MQRSVQLEPLDQICLWLCLTVTTALPALPALRVTSMLGMDVIVMFFWPTVQYSTRYS